MAPPWQHQPARARRPTVCSACGAAVRQRAADAANLMPWRIGRTQPTWRKAGASTAAVPVRTYIIGHALNFATRSRFKVGWRHLGLATTPRTGAPGLETARNYVVGKPVPHVTAETFQFKNWATFGFQRYSWLRLNFRQRRIHYTRDQPQKLDSRRHDIRTTGWPASRGLEGQLVVRFRPFRLRFELRAK
jgi:hypothetical protein